MRRLLIFPPFADPTQPYLGPPVLKGYLSARGLDVWTLDLNIEGLHHLLTRGSLERLQRRLEARLSGHRREAKHQPAPAGARLELRRGLRWIEELRGTNDRPLDELRDAGAFYDRTRYERARRKLEGVFVALNELHHPFTFGFDRAGHVEYPGSLPELLRYAEEELSPLSTFYEERLGEDELGEVELVGLSVAFESQLPEAFTLARFFRHRAPSALVVLGGPCIHQIVVHLPEAVRARLFEHVDAIGLYEGEETLAALIPRLASWRSAPTAEARAEVLRDVPNLLTWDATEGCSRLGPRHVLDLEAVPAPDFDDLDLDRYLTPSRTLLYAPTRGCYWGRCSFCYYGLADHGSAPYREVPPARAAADLTRLARRHGVRNFALACDVLHPRYALAFAEAVLARGLELRWHADLRLAADYTPEACARLHRSGLRAAAFGVESGAERVRKAMGKGCELETALRAHRAFHSAGIASQWMTFTDHPGETVEEAMATVRLLEAERERIALFHVGEFGLQWGSAIAQDPRSYGVSSIVVDERDELRLRPRVNGTPRPRNQRLEHAIDRVAERYALAPYPWAGAISSNHSFLYFLRYGPNAFRR